MKRLIGHRKIARKTLPFIMVGVLGAMPVIGENRAYAQDAPATPPTPAPAPAPLDAEAKTQAIQAYNAGLDAVRKSDWTSAAASFEKAVTLDPKDTSSFMFLGFVRLKQEKFDDALTALQTAEKMISPADTAGKATLYNNMGLVYWNKNQPSDAIAAYKKALDFDKKASDAQYNLAFALLAQKRYSDATPQLEALVKTSTQPEMVAALYDALGEAYENQKNWAGALGAYTKAIESLPKEPAYQLHKGLALINSNRKGDAVPFLAEVIKLDPQSTDPQSAEAFLQLGAIYIEKRNWSEAQDKLTRYVALRKDDSLGWFNLGVAFDYASNFDKALEAYAKAEKLDPKNAAIHNNVGRIHFKRGKFDEAISELQEALKLDKQSPDAQHNLAIVYSEQARILADQKKTEESKAKYATAESEWRGLLTTIEPQWRAETDADRKSQLATLVAGARAGLAENFLNQQNYRNAVFEYTQMLIATPDNNTARINLGLALYYDKKYPEAEKVYREVIAKEKTNATAYNNLGAVLEAQDKKGDALEAYKKAADLDKNYAEAKNNLDRLMQNTKVG